MGVFQFDLQTSAWSSRAASGLTDASTLMYSYRRAATDGDTRLIYIPSGASGGSEMVVLNPDTLAARMVDMPPASLLDGVIQLYGWIWSDLRKSFLFTGGEYSMRNSDKTLEYFPASNTWAALVISLSYYNIRCHPASYISPLHVSGYNGRKIVVNGGQEFPEGQAQLRGLLYVLDVPTLTWTQGPSVDDRYVAADMACTVTGVNFVA
ncbi:hypothetical protein BGX24_001089 [Mortierella sp. AD032]|nr:hypothetical protein BGX24_001089 [Mortierella sp. AD032]